MAADHSPSSSTRHYVLVAIKLAVSVGLLTLLFSRIDAGRLWAGVRHASIPWLGLALGIYVGTILANIWRWQLLLRAQDVQLTSRALFGSLLVALFFNNFLPSNIGGDVIRISDTARPSGSKTLATAIVFVDRLIGLMGLAFVAAVSATVATAMPEHGRLPIRPVWLWAGFVAGIALSTPALLAPDRLSRLLQPLTVFHPEWVGDRLEKLTAMLVRFRNRRSALAACFAGAVGVQLASVVFYAAVAHALRVPVAFWDLAVIVPISFVVQMLPVSVNGFGVREATFSFYFARIGLPLESALLVALVPTALVMLFSLGGAAVYISRRH
jgi:glycosyltransferase 2 family protein